jgi:hypothetical protein
MMIIGIGINVNHESFSGRDRGTGRHHCVSKPPRSRGSRSSSISPGVRELVYDV